MALKDTMRTKKGEKKAAVADTFVAPGKPEPGKRTTVYLPVDVHRAARLYTVGNGMSLSGLVERLLVEHLESEGVAIGDRP